MAAAALLEAAEDAADERAADVGEQDAADDHTNDRENRRGAEGDERRRATGRRDGAEDADDDAGDEQLPGEGKRFLPKAEQRTRSCCRLIKGTAREPDVMQGRSIALLFVGAGDHSRSSPRTGTSAA